MPLVPSTLILADAARGKYGVGAFNAHNMEMAQAVVQAAEEERAPVILQISQDAIRHAGLETAATLVKTLARRATVPVVLHLDHGTDFAVNMRCLREGFTSLMYDGSETLLGEYREETGVKDPPFEKVVELVQSARGFEENVRVTKSVVEAAHACGVPVEAELGKIPRVRELARLPGTPEGTLSPEARAWVAKLFASPLKAAEFVERTGCDSLAVACGSVHGMDREVQPLDVELVGKVAELTGVPLVLHGSSGVIRTREEAERRGIRLASHEGSIRDGIARGIAKINVSTELQITFLEAIRAHFAEHPGSGDARKVFGFAREALKEKVRSYIRLFGSSGRG